MLRINVQLVSKIYTVDSIGQRIPVETLRDVSAWVDSISAAEFNAGGESGFKRDKRVTVWAFEYGGEDEIDVEGVRYSIYRTYRNSAGKTELYLEKRVGNE